MISVTKLLFARNYYGDALRYTQSARQVRNGTAEGITCNLRCRHCYMDSDSRRYSDELTTVARRKSSSTI